MKYTVRIFLFLLILGVIFVGFYLKLDSNTKTERYTGPQTVDTLMEAFDARYSSQGRSTAAETLHGEKQHITFTMAGMDTKYPRGKWIQKYQLIAEAYKTNPEMEEWIVIGENALPQVPGIIYVQKTESTANIWHTCPQTKLETGEILSVEGSELSERQRLNLLNTGAVPKGWEVVYVDEDGNPTHRNR